MYIKAVTGGFWIEKDKFLVQGQTAKVTEDFVSSIQAKVNSGDISVHPEDPNKKHKPRAKKKKEE